MPRYTAFVAGVADALDRVRREHAGDVLMVSSGGPISTVVAQVLGAPARVVLPGEPGLWPQDVKAGAQAA